MTNIETVTISKEEYEELQKESRFLNALITAGVSQWEGYDETISILEEWNQ